GDKLGSLVREIGAQQQQADSSGGHGYVEVISLLHPQGRKCAPSRHPLRQVSCPAPPQRGLGQNPQKRIWPTLRSGSPLYQRPEIYIACPCDQPVAGRTELLAGSACCQMAAEHSL